MTLPENIIAVVTASKSEEEAFNKILKIKNVPSDVAIAFRKKYDPERKLTKQEAFSKFYRDFKNN